jgi:hypothetical protein
LRHPKRYEISRTAGFLEQKKRTGEAFRHVVGSGLLVLGQDVREDGAP